MDYFLPSFVQKRLLRYALSRLELVDTEAIDLDSLGIRWGQRSTVELRGIGLRLEKLSSVLQLPSTCKLLKASTSLIRVTIPADIYNSGISFEVDGIDVHIQLLSDNGSKNDGLDSSDPRHADSGTSDQSALPTADDLAQSFVQSEPKQERAEIEAAISSRSQYLQRSTTSLSDDDEVGLGNPEVSLPSFISAFLQGIVSRLEIKASNVSLRVDMDLPQDGFIKKALQENQDKITTSFIIKELSVGSVSANEDQKSSLSNKTGRKITLDSIGIIILSDSDVFSNFAQFAAPPSSPSTTYSKTSHLPETARDTTQSPPASSSGDSQSDLAQSVLLNKSQMIESSRIPSFSGERSMENSVDSLDGRFSDAESEPDHNHQYQEALYSGNHYDAEDEDFADSPGYLDDVFHSQFVDEPGDPTRSPPQSPQNTGTPRPQSPQVVTSQASQAPEIWHDFDEPQREDDAEDRYFIDSLSHRTETDLSPGTPRLPSLEPNHAPHDGRLSKPSDGSLQDYSSDSGSYHGSPPDELSESKLFSHEEASSMYMSAMSGIPSHDAPAMPGAWDSSSSGSGLDSLFQGHKAGSQRVNDQDDEDNDDAGVSTPKLALHPPGQSVSEKSNQEASQTSPELSQHSVLDHQSSPTTSKRATHPQISRKILNISKITIWVPEADNQEDMERHAIIQRDDQPGIPLGQSSRSDIFQAHKLDDSAPMRSSSTFSSIAFEGPGDSGYKGSAASDRITSGDSSAAVVVNVGDALLLFDMATGWLLVKACQKLLTAFSPDPSEKKSSDNQSDSVEESKTNSFKFSLQSCTIKFLEHLTGIPYSESPSGLTSESFSTVADSILEAHLSSVNFDMSNSARSTKFNLEVTKFVLGCPSEALISFNKELKMRESIRDIQTLHPRDISLTIVKTPRSAEVNIATLPLHLNLNIQRLEDILGSFGGLSTLLELGSSMASISTVRGDSLELSKKPTRGVRFEGVPSPQSPPPTVTSTPWKLNSRLGGFIVDIVGESCALKLNTTAVKTVSRHEGIGIMIDKARIIGPCLVENDGECPGTLNVENLRVEYLYSPKEIDLDRLLSLLTPSKDKYEQDDDIMLDTLFRQRRQGGVLRVSVTAIKLRIYDIHGLEPLSTLPAEIGRLSSVAKYLPEDDRPGIMTLLLIREFECNMHVDERIGRMRLLAQDTEMAHISIPSLIAVQMKKLAVIRNEIEELIGEALEIPSNESANEASLPMIMARFIADEMDPTVKIKLHNLKAEYTLPSIIAFLGVDNDTTPEEMVAHMASSIANLTDLQTSQSQETSVNALGRPATESKPSKLAISLRDCVVGLNPRDMAAKGLVVFTYAKFKWTSQGNEHSEANLEIKKATLMIIDDISMIGRGGATTSRRITVDSQNEQVEEFAQLGFVPVSYISSAVFLVKILPPDIKGDKSIDVEVRDDLLILETCADSTQTLIGLLNGLAPPSLPSTTLKYRTEVMPLQDMLSSFTGEAFSTEEATDVQETSIHEAESTFGGALDDEVDYVSDFYPEIPDTEEPIRTSMMDPMDPMADMARSRHFMDSFHSEYNVSSSVTGLEFQDDHFARKSTVGGTAHRWDSTHNTYGLANEVKLHGSPLRVRVRDVHFIWNLFDGYDWQRTRDTISKAVKDVETKAAERRAKTTNRFSPEDDEEESVIGDFLFNSIYIGIPANKDPRELSRAINHDIDDMASETGSYITSTTVTGYSAHHQNRPVSGRGRRLRLSRSKHHKMTFELKGISADFVVFPPDMSETQSTIDIRVNDLDIFDHIPTSTWKKFATYMNDAGERESGTSMVHLEILNVKPVAELAASEIVLKATVLPIRLHVDQDALDFLSRFFEFKDETAPAPSSSGDAPFLQRVEVNAVRVKLDFKPKRVDYGGLRSGRTTEFMNFFILDEADMVLRHVIIYGVSGFDRLGQTLNDIWMPDIKRNQLPGVLAGLAPIRSLVNVGSGVKDLVVIPMREYKKDGRIVRSIQKGALSFAKTTTNELIKLGAKLAIGTQTVLQNAEDFLNSPKATAGPHLEGLGDGDDSGDEEEKKRISHYADQPVGVVQGLRGAFRSLERDLLVARDAIVAVPGEVMESTSAAGAAKAVWRHAPTVILRPAIGATSAVGQTLLGAGNSLDPSNRRRIEDKYKRH